MNQENTKYLFETYEPLYDGRHLGLQYNLMGFGFECGDGWFNIIDNLSYILCSDWLAAKKEYDFVAGRIGQLKYTGKATTWNAPITLENVNDAQIRMIEMYDNVPMATQVKEKFGTLRFYTNSTLEEHDGAIRMAEAMSAVTCDVCGNPGTLNGNGWISCRCEEHK